MTGEGRYIRDRNIGKSEHRKPQKLPHKGHPVDSPFRKLRVAQGRLRNAKGSKNREIGKSLS